jgi:hypothetical protein
MLFDHIKPGIISKVIIIIIIIRKSTKMNRIHWVILKQNAIDTLSPR